MGQTVNLLATPSEVRILLPPQSNYERGNSSFGRATAFQAVGGGFEPRFPLKSADVAQGQSVSLVRKRSWVQFPSSARLLFILLRLLYKEKV
jgi:hypothetical protein